MSTTAQTEANRRNAKSSTGPRSPEGKSASSQNALKTGIDAQILIIRGENVSDLESLASRYLDRFQPSTPEQSLLVDAMISADWLLRRLRKVEPQIWERQFKDSKTWSQYNKNVLLGDAFSHGQRDFLRLQRRLDSIERTYRRALDSFRALRPDCFKATPEPASPLPSTEIGFVPSTSTDPPEPAPESLPSQQISTPAPAEASPASADQPSGQPQVTPTPPSDEDQPTTHPPIPAPAEPPKTPPAPLPDYGKLETPAKPPLSSC